MALISALYLSVIFFFRRLATQWLITSPHRLRCYPLRFPAARFMKKTAGYNGPTFNQVVSAVPERNRSPDQLSVKYEGA